jgi:hypothetical protein
MPMAVTLNGASAGNAALIRIYHVTTGQRMPQVAVLYANGFVRLKQNADPAGAPIPFGTSAVLGPAYWPKATTYHHNPQLRTLRLTTSALPARLELQATGTNQDLKIVYRMQLPAPTDELTRLRVIQTVRATSRVAIDPERARGHEGYKTAAQLSTMFINQGGVCDGGFRDCHDADAGRYVARLLVQRLVAFRDLAPPALVFAPTEPLGGRWVDALHRDDTSWQGNTPSVRVCVDPRPAGRTFTPGGYLAATTNPNDDNVGLWLQDDHRASVGFATGEEDRIAYWIVAQDDLPTSDPQRCW